jgi:cytochrome d ubiquinol oxidase subunit I
VDVEVLPRHWENLELVRKLVIAESWQIHILHATFLLGAGAIAPIAELIGMLNRQPFYERFAKGMSLVNVVVYSVGAVLAIAAVFVTLGFYPKFFTLLFLQFYWFLIAEEITFMGQLYIVLLYYFLWDKLGGRWKPVHVLLGLTWIPMAVMQQSQIIAFQGFSLTPAPASPFFNPGFIPQMAHRFMGNFSWAGFAIAAFAAIQHLRYRKRGDADRMAFYDWLGSLGLVFGVGFMVFFMALSGYSWSVGVKGASPSAFYSMMVGSLAWVFQLQMFFIGFALTVASFYMWRRLSLAGATSRWAKRFALCTAAFWVLGSIPYFIGPSAERMWVSWTIPIGAMRPWKYLALLGVSIGGLGALLSYVQGARNGLNWGKPGVATQKALITTGLLGVSMMVTMGIIREAARLPGQIHGQMDAKERVIPEGVAPAEEIHRPKLGPLRGP